MCKRLLTPALLFVILFALGCERKLPVQESEKALLLRAVDLVSYGFTFENIERYETFTKVKSFDGSYDLEYEVSLRKLASFESANDNTSYGIQSR